LDHTEHAFICITETLALGQCQDSCLFLVLPPSQLLLVIIYIIFSLFGYCREKNKRRAEQGAALVCLCAVGVIDIHTLTHDGNVR